MEAQQTTLRRHLARPRGPRNQWLADKSHVVCFIKVKIRQPKEDQYTFNQYATAASIPGTSQQYLLDNERRTEKDALYGDVTGRSLWVDLGQIQEAMADMGGDWEEGDGRLIVADGGKT